MVGVKQKEFAMVRCGLPFLISFVLASGAAHAQFGRGGSEWMASGADAQRSSWVRSDAKISTDALRKGGFVFLWKTKLAPPDAGLTDAALLDRYIGYRGFRSFAFVGGPNGTVAAVDTDLNRIEWQRNLGGTAQTSCAKSAVTLIARPTSAAFPAASPGGMGLGGRGGPAKSGVGEPYEGAVTLKQVSATGRGFPGFGRGPGMFRRIPTVLFALTPDGMLHEMYVSNGAEPHAPLKFLPSGSAARGLLVIQNIGDTGVNNTAYAVTGDACGAPSAVWALDVESGKVSSWKPGAPIAGDLGFAMAPDGTTYAAAGSAISALDPKSLAQKDAYSADDAIVSSPVVVELGKRVAVAAQSKSGKVVLLDSASLKTPIASAAGKPVSGRGVLASWTDRAGNTWIAASSGNAVTAMKAPSLEPVWTSPAIGPAPFLSIVNDVVFAAGQGNPGTLYALDSATGQPVWNSGKTIPSRINGPVSGGGGQVYVTDREGMLYAFGYPMERE